MNTPTYTDNQLKRTIAKLLPNDLFLPIGGNGDELTWSNASELCLEQRRGYYVLDTELLFLCREIEQGMDESQQEPYIDALCATCGNRTWSHATASWQHRIIAAAQTLNVEIG